LLRQGQIISSDGTKPGFAGFFQLDGFVPGTSLALMSGQVGKRQPGDNMRVGDLMKKEPPFCVPFDTARGAASIMKHHDVSFIPIIENEPTHMLVGVVTDRDLCLRVVAEGKDPNEVQLADCMTNAPVVCHPQDDIGETIQLMVSARLHQLPVVDENGSVQGVISLHDALQNILLTKARVR
jgi:CBS domain-containing protein